MAVEKTDDVGVSLAPRAPSRPKSLWQVGPGKRGAARDVVPRGCGQDARSVRRVLSCSRSSSSPVGGSRRKKKKIKKPEQALLWTGVLLNQISATYGDMMNMRTMTRIVLSCDFVTVSLLLLMALTGRLLRGRGTRFYYASIAHRIRATP